MLFRGLSRSLRVAFPVLFLSMAMGACSATDGEGNKSPRGQGDNGPGPGGTGGGSANPFPDDDDLDDDPNLDEGSACAADKRSGELVPLDMYVMLDKSGSMSGAYWASVKQAFKDFVDSNESHGMGMGIQYFPTKPKAPIPPAPPSCQSDTDCAPYHGDCLPWGQCEGTLIPPGFDDDSCNPDDYKIPDVSLSLLPMVAPKIKASLDAQKASGGTPTYPALRGAHQYAKDWAAKNAGHVTIVVLATDGAPSGCGSATNNTSSIADLADQARKTNPSVLTFVIGVGDDVGGDLDIIAKAGGTDQAIFVDGGKSQEFLDALTKIRGSVACEYRIPVPKEGQEADYERVNVNVTIEGKTETIGRVSSQSDCDADKGGWYYDDPKDPTKILLCHKTCQLVKSGSQMAPVEVDVLLGCKSKVW